nr:f-box protein cpr30 [Quercus suber]
MGRDGVGEVVVGESESAERVEEAEFGGEVAGEGLVREEKGGDAVASANNAGPVAWVLNLGSGSVYRGGIGKWKLECDAEQRGYAGDAQSLVVLSFDLGDEVFSVISLPNGKFGLGADIGISVFNGLLSLLSYGYQHMSSFQCCSVWVMKEYGVVDSWTKQFTIELNMLHWKVLGFLKNGHVLVQKIGSHRSKLLSYDPESEQVKNLGFYRSTYYSYADNYVRNFTFLTNQMM